LKLVGGIAALLIGSLVVLLIKPSGLQFQIVASVLLIGLLFQAFDTIEYWFESEIKSKYAVLARTGALTISAALKVGLILIGAPLVLFAAAILVETALAAVGLVLVYRFVGYRLRDWQFSFVVGRKLLTHAWPLLLSGLAVVTYMKLDILVIGQLLDESAVGLYGAATRLAEIWYFIPMAVLTSVFPMLLGAKGLGQDFYLKRLEHVYRGVTWLGLAVALPTSIWADEFVALVFGQEYAAAGSVLAIYIWGSIAVFLGVASSQHFVAENSTKVLLYRTLIGAVINLVANLMLIPRFGIQGAALATVASYFIATFSLVLFPSTRSHVKIMVASLKPSFSS
jgi:PST family polysaccharide transporter